MKKELKKIIINFSDINKKCDSDYKKLSDKCKNYELSHNRKLKLLEKIADYWNIKKLVKITTNTQVIEHISKWTKIIDEIESEINAPLRVKSKIHINLETNRKTNSKLKNIFQAARLVEEQRND